MMSQHYFISLLSKYTAIVQSVRYSGLDGECCLIFLFGLLNQRKGCSRYTMMRKTALNKQNNQNEK